MNGHSTAGLFGYSHLYGGYAGGQAEYARVPFADVGPIKIPDGIPDEQVLFLSDIFPTGYMAAENCNIHPGDIVAVWGCGPVGQFAIRSAFLLGAERVIAIDHYPERLRMAREGKAEVLNYEEVDVFDTLREMTGGRGPDSCIDAVGMESHGHTIDALYDRAKAAVGMTTDRVHAPPPGDRGVPQGGDGLDPRRLRRGPRQVPHRAGLHQGADPQDGPDPRPSLPEAPARTGPAGESTRRTKKKKKNEKKPIAEPPGAPSLSTPRTCPGCSPCSAPPPARHRRDRASTPRPDNDC